MKDYTNPRTNSQVIASIRQEVNPALRNSATGVVKRLSLPERCVWPDCEIKTWRELGLPLCQRHAARVHLAVDDVIPPETLSGHSQRGQDRGERADHWRNKPGEVYFAESADLIKIGFSTNPHLRMTSLKSEKMGVFTLVAKYSGTPEDEKRTLFHFGKHWVKGEYYRKGQDLMEYIDNVKRTGEGLRFV